MWQYWLAGIALAAIILAVGYGLGSRIAIERMMKSLALLEDTQDALARALDLMNEAEQHRASFTTHVGPDAQAKLAALALSAPDDFPRPLGTTEQQREKETADAAMVPVTLLADILL